jgi:hypothetical protein
MPYAPHTPTNEVSEVTNQTLEIGTYAWDTQGRGRTRVEIVAHHGADMVEILARTATRTQIVPASRLTTSNRPTRHMPEGC